MDTPHFMLVTEIDMTQGRRHTRYFMFPVDAGKDFCYRSRVSLNAFAFSTKHRNYYPSFKQPERLYYFRSVDEAIAPVPKTVIRLGSLWAFYEAVGYDYKTQKWNPPNLAPATQPMESLTPHP